MRKAFFAYLLILWAALALGFVAFAAGAWRALLSPFQLDSGEGVVLWQAQEVTALKTAYRSIGAFPHLVFNYPPVYHLASRLFDVAVGDLLMAGRLVSVLSMLGISVMSGLVMWHVLPRRMPMAVRASGVGLGALLCYGCDSVVWADYMRIDMLALFFELGGLYLYVLARRRPALGYAAVFCFLIALFTRPTTLAGPVACMATAAVVEHRAAAKLFGALAVCGTIALAALTLATDGAFFQHIFFYNRISASYGLLAMILKRNLVGVGSMTAVALASPIACVGRILGRTDGRLDRFRAAMVNSPSDRLTIVCGAFLLVAFGTSLTAARSGAADNYMLEWNLALAPLAALLFSDVLYRWRRSGRLPAASAAILLLPIIYIVANVGVTHFTHEDYEIARADRASMAVLDRIKQVEGPVYSTDLVLLYRAGKEPAAEPFMITALAERGQWDDTPFANRIASGYFGLIVSTTPLSEPRMYSPRVRTAIERAYEPSERIGGYTLYRPRPSVRNR